MLREFGRIPPLVFRRAAAVSQRLVCAARAGMIADIEIRTELRGRHVKTATNEAAAYDDGQKHDTDAEREPRGGPQTEPQNSPSQDDDNKDERILARQAQASDGQTQRQ